MEILVAQYAGFCFGVKRALEMAKTALKGDQEIASLGPLIHNPQVVARLEREGLRVVDSLQEVACGRLLIRSHGSPPEVYAAATAVGLEIVDATCPFVARAQRAAAELQRDGYGLVVVGDRDHAEARGILAHAGGSGYIVEHPDEVAELELPWRVGLVAQTTQRLDRFQAVVSAVLERVEELRACNTICRATSQRQESAVRLAEQVDVMIVVGGYNSANTSRLAELCRDTGTATYHVETAREVSPTWVADVERVGVTAGASTPQDAIDAVCVRLRDLEEASDGPMGK